MSDETLLKLGWLWAVITVFVGMYFLVIGEYFGGGLLIFIYLVVLFPMRALHRKVAKEKLL